MKTHNSILDRILNQDLRPWLPQNSIDEKFPLKFRTLIKYESEKPLQYQINFHRPFDSKTKYYSRLIHNSVQIELDKLCSFIEKKDDENVTHYILNEVLNKKIKSRLTDIGKLIRKRKYASFYINPQNTSYDLDQVHKANTYIIQLLKLGYIQLYLEIQAVYQDYIIDIFVVEDFYTQLISEPIPKQLPIQKIQIIELQPESIRKPKKKTDKPLQYKSFFYKQYNTNPDKLKDLWDSLILHRFICDETPLSTFRKIFSGEEIKTPVKWTGNISDLYYFIKRIHNDLKLVNNLKQQNWKITSICFVDENDNPFEFSKFRTLKRPKSTGDKIDNIVKLLE